MKILYSQNMVMWKLLIDMNVMSSVYFRFIKTAQPKTLKSLFSPEVSGCSDIWQQVSGFMARGPGLTPSGIPTGRETEPIMQMWRPLTWKSMPVNGLDLPAPALLILIGWLQFIIIFGSREDNSCHVRADDYVSWWTCVVHNMSCLRKGPFNCLLATRPNKLN